MNGIFAKIPFSKSKDGSSGMNPPGPSMVGSHGNSSGASAREMSKPSKISDVLTDCKHPKVLSVLARFSQPGTLATKLSQSNWRREALKVSDVAADPDSNICVGGASLEMNKEVD